jgi:hypothetical protein
VFSDKRKYQQVLSWGIKNAKPIHSTRSEGFSSLRSLYLLTLPAYYIYSACINWDLTVSSSSASTWSVSRFVRKSVKVLLVACNVERSLTLVLCRRHCKHSSRYCAWIILELSYSQSGSSKTLSGLVPPYVERKFVEIFVDFVNVVRFCIIASVMSLPSVASDWSMISIWQYRPRLVKWRRI